MRASIVFQMFILARYDRKARHGDLHSAPDVQPEVLGVGDRPVVGVHVPAATLGQFSAGPGVLTVRGSKNRPDLAWFRKPLRRA